MPDERTRPAPEPAHAPVEGPEEVLEDERHPEREAEAAVVRLRADLAAALAETDALRAERDAARREAAENLDKARRALLDFENYRRRTRDEAKTAREKAKEELLRDVLGVLDNFDRALVHSGAATLEEGVRLIHRQLLALVEREGLARIPTEGEAFDPNLHEAVARETREDAKEGVVIEEVARGYTLNGRVVRPARVKVAGPP